MNTTCPTCGKPVDPLRARSVGVRDGKVVAYCSTECARAAETKPTAMPRRTPPSGIVAGAASMLDSGPVIEIVRHDEGADDRSTLGTDPTQAQIRHERAPTPLPVAASRKTPLILVLVVVLGGAGAYLVYRYLLQQGDVSASTQPREPRAAEEPAITPAAVAPDAPVVAPVVDREASVGKARSVLTTSLGSDSPRVQRVAAAALARTGDAPALELLGHALEKETSDVARLELAYALARSADKRGTDVLVAGLGSARRDVRAEAGRMLARLGDPRAVPALSSYLDVTQLRLGAAEQLAYLADARAITVLEQVRADAKSSADDKARATIALGVAGKTDVIPALRDLLKDGRFNAFAAATLAQLQDPAARPVLIEQLAIPSLRVQAARALRRLEPTLDPTALLPALLAALDSHKDTERVQISEAILLLAGPPAWSEHP